eukprot:8489175-Karenia_brevis.AAC.1
MGPPQPPPPKASSVRTADTQMTPGFEKGLSVPMKRKWVEDLAREDPVEAKRFVSWIEAQITALSLTWQQNPLTKQQTKIHMDQYH